MHAGPHGAGLTNIIHAPRNASVVEFYMNPMSNRCFGFMSMVLGLDYWILPQVQTHFFGDYHMDGAGVAAAVRLVRHLLEAKGLGHVVRGRDEL